MQITKLFGPPGTGKTYSLLQIMEQELAKGIKPDRIAFLTFTVQARREAVGRVTEKFGYTADDLPHFKTLHAICYRELNMTTAGLVSGTKALIQLGERLGLAFTPQRHRHEEMLEVISGGEVGDQLLRFDHYRRHRLQTVDQALVNYAHDEVDSTRIRYFVDEYQRWKKRETLLDFTDLLEQVEHPLDVDVVIVDEAQDLSRLQWRALHVLAASCQRLYLAGDDDQAIFSWAGADATAFIDHEGKSRVLPQSHRVPSSVAKVANHISSKIRYRQPKQWAPRQEAGKVAYVADLAGVPLAHAAGTTLVLYRHHYLADDIVQRLRDEGVAYQRNDQPAPGAEWGNTIVFWERLRRGVQLTWKEAAAALDGLVVGRGITAEGKQLFRRYSKDTWWGLAELQEHCGLRTIAPWYEALTKIRDDDKQYLRLVVKHAGAKALTEQPSLRLSTIHAAKGAEADHVVLLTDVSRRVREAMDLSPDDERRVFYVGVTRARDTLHIVGTDNYLFQGQ